ncbi:MAG: CDP-alcohol phosphatidyltransferase family protein [Methanomicrobiales archaeon]|nr:CDP-alcohol phosphatidyltransferase family protein [Methanomicrobiales archaeon]
MSWLYAFKPVKDRILYPVSHALRVTGVTPNMITIAGVLMSAVAGLLTLSGYLYTGIVVFVLGAGLDAFDGSFARACGMCSAFGQYFDGICDRLSELVFIAGAVAGGAPVSAVAVAAGSVVLLGSRIYNHHRGLTSDGAMFGRPERLTLLILGLLTPAPYASIVFGLAGILCLISSAQILASGGQVRTNRAERQKTEHGIGHRDGNRKGEMQ